MLAGITLFWQAADAGTIDEVKASLVDLIGPRAVSSEVIESPMEGVFQVNMGDRVIYASKVGNFMLLGEVYDTERKISLADEIQQQKALATIEAMDAALPWLKPWCEDQGFQFCDRQQIRWYGNRRGT